MADPREPATAEVLRRTPAARRGLVRRLLRAPFERPALVSLPVDHLTVRAATPRPPRRYLRVKVALELWGAAGRGALGRAARGVVSRLRRLGPGPR